MGQLKDICKNSKEKQKKRRCISMKLRDSEHFSIHKKWSIRDKNNHKSRIVVTTIKK